MSREEFLQSMLYVTTAVSNTTEYAAHATYLLAVSEKDKSIAQEGLVDVPKVMKGIASVYDTCVSVVMDPEQAPEEKKVLEKHMEELLRDLDDGVQKTKDQQMKQMLQACRQTLDTSAKTFYAVVHQKKSTDIIRSSALLLSRRVTVVSSRVERAALAPVAGPLAQDTQALCDDVLKHSTALLTSTQDLIKEVKQTPEQSEVRWSAFSKRKEVLAAFDALLKSIKSNGQDASILEADAEEGQNKSYVEIQSETAFKWLHKPMTKSDVKAKGQEAVKNLIEVGRKMSEDLSGADKEDMRHLVEETEQLLTHCSKKYDQEQYSLLMERIRELRKAIERAAVVRVVEDFMDAEEPLQDLDILADAADEKTRQFLLERKIAELLAQLGRVSRTARFIADTGTGGARVHQELRTCSEQTELLAPMLVKAAQERIHKPDDKAVIENYKALLAQFTESLSKVRDLCDQSVEPMAFVQAAGDTMQRMREDSTSDGDPMKCALTSTAITKLANRVIHVGLSSSTARADPELQRALGEAQQQLSAATPAPDTRASKMPDWKDTTAKVLALLYRDM
ncbi:vinculin-like [Anticarsia gemmatalis]|uniref:vinculin-like n=1 Tax=Anticarsia gemmatalis TaxID=129554 RepID=UPI003F76D452